MICLSTAKPFSASPEYARNQARASASLQGHFSVSQMYYVGHYEEGLDSDKTRFVRPEGDYPTIKFMADFASKMTATYVAILNADIILTSPIVDVEKAMYDMALPAATSYRHEFDAERYPESLDDAVRDKEDRGMDIFIATPEIWKLVAREIPGDILFGHNRWDSWVCGYFCHNLGYGFRQFTDKRCVFHPKHGGRSQPLLDTIKTDSPYFTRAKRPSPL